MIFRSFTPRMPSPGETLAGRPVRLVRVPSRHEVLGTPLEGPFPDGFATAYFALGCFWGAERQFWKAPGVYSTAVGYQGGTTPNPTYEEVCSGLTGHTEAVQVVFDPAKTTYEKLLKLFWESHDPTQGFRQGNDVGTQYRSAVYATSPAQRAAAIASRDAYQHALDRKGYGHITTEIAAAGPFWYAEDYHQQYLAETKNPNGYCGLGGTGVKLSDPSAGESCPIGLTPTD